VDFLLVLIKLFSLGVTAESLRANCIFETPFGRLRSNVRWSS